MCEEKFRRLEEKIRELAKKDICVAFSGGIDSSLILKLAARWTREYGNVCYAVTFSTRLHPKADVSIAERVSKECDAEFVLLKLDETENQAIWNNPMNRCYLCKRYLFEKLKAWAEEREVSTILEGSNADDKLSYRPGIRAIQELSIKSPLMETDFSKEEVRQFARKLEISVANRPSQPCMATRIPYNTRLDFAVLDKLEEGEEFLQNLGFSVVRLRLHNQILRIEIKKEQMIEFLSFNEKIINKMKQLGFLYVTLDLEGFRSGSMDIDLFLEFHTLIF